jgi:hypothetical protein
LRYPFDPLDPELADLREMLALLKCGVTLLRLRQDLKYHEMKYSDDQPRWPMGDPRGGQWRPLEGGEGEDSEAGGDGEDGGGFFAIDNDSLSFGEAPDGTPIEPVAGIPDDKLNWTTQQFMSAYCKGRIREVMPGQFLNMQIGDVIALANQGNAAANRCLKLLKQGEYRK